MATAEQLVPVGFSLAAALCWGTSDFSGGYASRRSDSFLVTALSHAVGFILMLALALFLHPDLPSRSSQLWAAAAGALGGVALLLFYRALSQGMGVAAPVSAVLGAAIPAAFTMITHGPPGKLGLAGFLLAGLGIWLISRPDGSRLIWRRFHRRPGRNRLCRIFHLHQPHRRQLRALVGRVFPRGLRAAGRDHRALPSAQGAAAPRGCNHRNLCWMPGRHRHRPVHSGQSSGETGFGSGSLLTLSCTDRFAGPVLPKRTVHRLENRRHHRRRGGGPADRAAVRQTELTWGQPPSAVQSSAARQSWADDKRRWPELCETSSGASLRRTAGGGCPTRAAIIKNCAHAYEASDSLHHSS